GRPRVIAEPGGEDGEPPGARARDGRAAVPPQGAGGADRTAREGVDAAGGKRGPGPPRRRDSGHDPGRQHPGPGPAEETRAALVSGGRLLLVAAALPPAGRGAASPHAPGRQGKRDRQGGG